MNLRDYVKQYEKPGVLTSRDEMRLIVAAQQAIALQELAKSAACIADQVRELRLEMTRSRNV